MAEAGGLELHRETMDPGALADDAVRAFRPLAEQAEVVLARVLDAGTPGTIEADPVRLAEVLTNLLTNASRHTPSGGRVTVRVGSESHGGVSFAVEDTGRGIAPELLPFVFDRFTTSADTDGTGLGLAIAKRLVEAHGGTVVAESELQHGTTIRCWFPPGSERETMA